MWQGKDSKRTFLLPAQFIYLHPPPHSLRRTISPSLPRFQAFSFGDHGEGFFFRGGVGGVAVAILAASLSSGKKAGFSDINGSVGGMAGGVG